MEDLFIELAGNCFQLLPQKAAYWNERRTLIIADTHFGKATHFRKAGIPVSDEVFLADLRNLDALIARFNCNRVIVVGDFFHSDFNTEWNRFSNWLHSSSLQEWLLVPGNHDNYTRNISAGAKFQITPSEYFEAGILFKHEPTPSKYPLICGHVHPGINLKGNARQRLKLPCFVYNNQLLMLPAFGKFTGLGIVKPVIGNRYFMITEQAVIEAN